MSMIWFLLQMDVFIIYIKFVIFIFLMQLLFYIFIIFYQKWIITYRIDRGEADLFYLMLFVNKVILFMTTNNIIVKTKAN